MVKVKKGGENSMYMTSEELNTFLSGTSELFTQLEMNAVKDYLLNGYDINEELRCSNNINSLSCANTVDKIDRSFRKFTIPKSFCLFRGVPSPLQYMMEQKVCDKGYCSTSKSFAMGRHFMTYEDTNERCCVFHIHFQKGQKIKMIPVKYNKNSGHLHEQEILFPRNTEFRVITDKKLLKNIQSEMGYELLEIQNSKFEDRFADEDGVMKDFGFQVFRKVDGKPNDYVLIIPIQVVQVVS